MRKTAKYATYTLASIIILAALLVLLAYLFIDPNQYKTQISQYVERTTGHPLKIKGDIDWSFYPVLGFRIKDVELGNPTDFTMVAPPLAQIGEADISMRLIPLLEGRVEAGSIVLKNTSINLIKNEKGQTNWQGLVQQTKPQMEYTRTTSKPAGRDKKLQVEISTVDVSNAELAWIDQSKNQTYEIQDLSFSGKNLGFDQAFPIKMNFTAESSQPKISARLNLSGQINLSKDLDTIKIGNLFLDGDVNSSKLNLITQFNLKSNNVVYNAAAQQLNVDNLKLNGKLLGKGYENGALPFSLTSNANLDNSNQTLELHPFSFQLANITVQGALNGKSLYKDPRFQGNVTIPQFNAAKFLSAVGHPVQFKSPQALNQVQAQANIAVSSKSIKLSHLKGQLDQSNLSGDISYNNADQHNLDFDLAIDQINIDQYHTAQAAAKSTLTTPATPAQQPAPAKPIQTKQKNGFAGLKITGVLQINQLTADNAKMQSLKANVTTQHGIIMLNPFSVKLYNGSAQGTASIDTTTPLPVYQANLTVNTIQLQPLLQDAAKSQRITGTLSMNAVLHSQGNDADTMLRNLNGQSQFDLKNGVINGIDIDYEIERAIAIVKKEPLPARTREPNTPFDVLVAQTTITNGVMYVPAVQMSSQQLHANGQGTINLVNDTLDGLATVTLTDKPEWQVPLKVWGDLDKLKVAPDIGEIAKQEVKKQLEKQIEKILPPEMQGAIRQLLPIDLGQDQQPSQSQDPQRNP